MRRLILLLVGLLLATSLGGCATLRGMGEDLQNLGKGIKKTMD